MFKHIIRKRDVCCRIAYFSYLDRNFVVNGYILMAVIYFRYFFLPKEMILNIWFAIPRIYFKYFVCQTNDGVVPVY